MSRTRTSNSTGVFEGTVVDTPKTVNTVEEMLTRLAQIEPLCAEAIDLAARLDAKAKAITKAIDSVKNAGKVIHKTKTTGKQARLEPDTIVPGEMFQLVMSTSAEWSVEASKAVVWLRTHELLSDEVFNAAFKASITELKKLVGEPGLKEFGKQVDGSNKASFEARG